LIIVWFFKWLLAIVSTLLVAALFLLLSSYLLLRAPLVYQTLLPKIRPFLEEKGIRLDQLNSLEIDLLRGIKISGLKLHWQQNQPQWAMVQLAEFELHYSLAELLKKRRLLLETVRLKQLDLEAEFILPEQIQEADTKPMDWQQQLQLLPLPLQIKNIVIEESHLTVSLQQAGEKLLIETGLDYQAQLQFQGSEIDSQQQLNLTSLKMERVSGVGQQLLSDADFVLQLGLNIDDLQQQPKARFSADLNFSSTQLQHKTTQLELALKPKIQLNLKGTLKDLRQPLETLSLQFEQQALIKQVKFQQRPNESEPWQTVQLAEQKIELKGDYQQGQVELQVESSQRQLQLPQLKQALNSRQVMVFSTDLELKTPQLKADFFLQQQPLLSLNLKAKNEKGRLILTPEISLYAQQNLLAYSDLAKPLHQFGGQKVELHGEMRVNHQQQNMQSADLKQWMQWPAELTLHTTLTQLSKPQQKNSPIYKQPIQLDLSLNKKSDYQISWQLKAPKLKLAELKRPIALEWSNSSQLHWPLQQLTLSGELKIDQKPAFTYQIELDDRAKKAQINTVLGVTLDPRWQRYHPLLKQLDQLGRTDLNWSWQATLKHDKQSLLSLLQSDPLQSEIKLQSTLIAQQKSAGTLLQLSQPLKLKQQLNWSGRGFELASQLSGAQVSVSKLFKAKKVALQLQLAMDDPLLPKKVRLKVDADAQSLIFDQGFETAPLLFPLHLSAKGRQVGRELELTDFNLDLSKKLFELELSANFDPQSNSGQVSGLLQSRLRPNLLQQPALSGSGRVSLPWQLTLEEGQRASLAAEMQFNDFSLSLEQMALDNINGSLKIAEELQLNDDNSVGFRYLLHVDPFQRVDYSRVQPQLLSRQNLSIERLQQDRYQAGPLHASLGLEQNLLRLQQFDLALYGGFITGQFYLDATPGRWKVGLLSRLSQVNLQPLLAENSAYKNSSQAPISARTALEFDLQRRLLEGRIDISDISREQLLQLLELFDPNYEDEQLAKIRAALQVAYPEWLALKMQKGLLDLELSLSLIPGTLRVQNLPLSPILQRFAGAALDKIEALPLQ